MLGEMIAVEAGAVVGLDQLQPVLEMPVERLPAVVQMVKNPKPHSGLPLSSRYPSETRVQTPIHQNRRPRVKSAFNMLQRRAS